jgi:hypothetical protein
VGGTTVAGASVISLSSIRANPKLKLLGRLRMRFEASIATVKFHAFGFAVS